MSAFMHWNVSDSGMAFDPQTGESFHLNDTACQILRLLRQGKSIEETSQEIANKYQILYEHALTVAMEFQIQLSIMSAP